MTISPTRSEDRDGSTIQGQGKGYLTYFLIVIFIDETQTLEYEKGWVLDYAIFAMIACFVELEEREDFRDVVADNNEKVQSKGIGSVP